MNGYAGLLLLKEQTQEQTMLKELCQSSRTASAGPVAG